LTPHPPTPPLSPYPTLFRSQRAARGRAQLDDPVHGSHHPAHVTPQRERERRRGIEVRRDVAEEVHGDHEPERRHDGEDEDELPRSEEHTSELQSLTNIVCRL